MTCVLCAMFYRLHTLLFAFPIRPTRLQCCRITSPPTDADMQPCRLVRGGMKTGVPEDWKSHGASFRVRAGIQHRSHARTHARTHAHTLTHTHTYRTHGTLTHTSLPSIASAHSTAAAHLPTPSPQVRMNTTHPMNVDALREALEHPESLVGEFRSIPENKVGCHPVYALLI